MDNVSAPLVGTWHVEVQAVRPFEIHGDRYYELHIIRLDDPAKQLLALRLPEHASKNPPVPGQKLAVNFLMGQVTSAEPIP